MAAIIKADLPLEMTVFSEVEPDSFDVLDTGKSRNAADVLAIEGEVHHAVGGDGAHRVAVPAPPRQLLVRRSAALTHHQIVQTLQAHPRIREFVPVADRIAAETGMIKSAAGAAGYLIEQTNKRAKPDDWYEGIIGGAGLATTDRRLMFRRTMFAMARRQAGVVQPPRYPRARRSRPQGVQRLGHRRNSARAAVHRDRS